MEVAPWEWVTVMSPTMSMTTMLVGPGKASGSQFRGSCHEVPSPPPSHETGVTTPNVHVTSLASELPTRSVIATLSSAL